MNPLTTIEEVKEKKNSIQMIWIHNKEMSDLVLMINLQLNLEVADSVEAEKEMIEMEVEEEATKDKHQEPRI